ncbi:MAG: hypothetical protein ACKVP4_05510 [Hyphomicrobium sp.]
MRQSGLKVATFMLPALVAGMLATAAVAEQGERMGGRDSAAKIEQGDARGGNGAVRENRMRGDDGKNYDGRKNGGSDRGARADRGGRSDKFDGQRRRYSGGNGQNRHWRSGRRYNWGPGFAFYFNDGYYYGECSWLKQRARQTGNPIWLRRFAQCRNAA